ncbi:hypothetical protein [Thalassospira xiamenensis]|uniref:hypothetical protein n=1 Tax=Thalassospira xiamenensis TaxID=220697 RepID=UPI003D80A80E
MSDTYLKPIVAKGKLLGNQDPMMRLSTRKIIVAKGKLLGNQDERTKHRPQFLIVAKGKLLGNQDLPVGRCGALSL